MNKISVLVVEDEALVSKALCQWLRLSGLEVRAAVDAKSAMECIKTLPPLVVISDVRMPGASGLDLMVDIRTEDPSISVILLTGHGDVPMAVQAMRDGAFDFLQKPYEPEQLIGIVERGAEQSRLRRELIELRRRLDGGTEELESRLIGSSEIMQDVRSLLLEIAAVDADVVILGETGTGKEVVARCIHDFSSRSDGPFVAVNCAALPSELIESELFGHEAGAFTGSSGRRIGKFEFANGGTLLLDEIESMPLMAQAKMLRVIQERAVERVGSNKSIPLDLRIIAATKVDLLQEAEAGRFRTDLYFRLNMASISLPPLRDRDDDSIVLFHHFMELAQRRFRKSVSPLHSWDIEALMAYTWPGNVRELKATADKFVLGLRGQGDALSQLVGETSGGGSVANLAEMIDRYERRIIKQELKRTGNSISAASQALGVPRRTMAAKITRLGISKTS